MSLTWQRVAPVVVSIVIIVLVAVLRNYSRTLAAITATMPINIPLALWIFHSGGDVVQEDFADFAGTIVVGMLPTILFAAVAWVAARAGWSLIPIIIAGYVAWGIALLVLLWLRGELSS